MISSKYIVQTLLGEPTQNDLINAYNWLKTTDEYGHSNRANLLVDYFTMEERLNTKGCKNINFYTFAKTMPEYFSKPWYIKIVKFCDENNRYIDNPIKRAKFIFGLYFGSISILKPTRVVEIIRSVGDSYTRVLNPFGGWGGVLVGCSIFPHIKEYISIETNINLREPYEKINNFIKSQGSQLLISNHWKNALGFDYSSLTYDIVICSPPYYNTEVYSHQSVYKTRMEWDELFYKPIFYNIYENLQPNGVICINICDKAYNAIREAIGDCDYRIPFKKVSRCNGDYKEYFYIWKKC